MSFQNILSDILIPVVMGGGLLLFLIFMTVVIETPVILKSGVTDNRRFICAINIITCIPFNMISVLLLYVGKHFFRPELERMPYIVWFVVAEALLIPISEALAYQKISDVKLKKAVLASYLANVLSCAAGLLVEMLFREISILRIPVLLHIAINL